MATVSASQLRSRVTDLLAPHGSGGVRTNLTGVVDLKALEEEQYGEVLESVDARLSTSQYSLVSMIVAGIYFGLLTGWWLMTTVSWLLIARWAIPVALVSIYGGYASYQTILEIRQLSEARSLLHTLEHSSTAANRSGE